MASRIHLLSIYLTKGKESERPVFISPMKRLEGRTLIASPSVTPRT